MIIDESSLMRERMALIVHEQSVTDGSDKTGLVSSRKMKNIRIIRHIEMNKKTY